MAKPGIKTSEGWFNTVLLVLAAVVVLSPLFVPNLPTNHWAVQAVAMASAGLAIFGYSRDRSKLKVAEAAGVDVAKVDQVIEMVKALPHAITGPKEKPDGEGGE